jgi:hypothetical protein
VKVSHIRSRALPLTLAALLLVPGCNGTRGGGGNSPGSRRTQPSPEGVLLQHKFAKGQLLRYDMRFKMNSDGSERISETMRAVIYQHCLGPVKAGPDPRFFKLHIVRKEVERLRKGRDRQGRDVPPITAVRNLIPEISPNGGYDKGSNKYCFPVNVRGVFGYSKKTPYHRVGHDSLVYLLPVLPSGKVKRGDVWTVEVPVYAGADYFYPIGRYRRGNDFWLTFRGRVDNVYFRAGNQLAQLSWTVSGVFDTQAYPERFPAAFINRQRIIHEVRSSGRAVFNATKGVLVSKNGQATTTFTHRMLTTRRDRDGKVKGHKWDETVYRHIIHYDCKLMAEDEPDPAPRRR